MKKMRAIRKQIPEILVVRVTEDSFSELIEQKILNPNGTGVDPSRNPNPSQVNIGDYLRVDNENDIYPISEEYFNNNFNLIEEKNETKPNRP